MTVGVPEGFWQREISHIPQPLTPMSESVLIPTANAGFRAAFERLGLMIETFEFRVIDGWGYARVVPLGGKDRKPPPDWLLRILIRVVPQLRRQVRRGVAAMREDVAGGHVDRWHSHWRPHLENRARELLTTDLGSLDSDGMRAHLQATHDLIAEGMEIHFHLHGSNAMLLGDLVFTCRDLLRWEERKALELLSGLSATSTSPAQDLARIAAIAEGRPEILEALADPTPATLAHLREVAPDFAAEIDAHQERYGHRAIRYEVGDVSLAEVPELVLSLVRDQLAHRYDPAADERALAVLRAERRVEAREALANRSEDEQARFERALERAERFYPLREENEFFTLSVPFAVMRYALRQAGRRLAAGDALAEPDDVFFLTYEELQAALAAPSDRRERVAERRARRAEVEATPAPDSYGEDPGVPSFAALPSEARFANEAMVWLLDRIFAPLESVREQPAGSRLQGISASPGSYSGPARVIHTEEEFHRIQTGDVLVCPVTSPVWSVLFPKIGALVTDTGGVLSHPAIIAREYRLPAVVGIGDATKRIIDGQRLTVDGESGVVTIAG